jgi:hypothetical protein
MYNKFYVNVINLYIFLFLYAVTLHSLDPKLVIMTVGCGISHTQVAHILWELQFTGRSQFLGLKLSHIG